MSELASAVTAKLDFGPTITGLLVRFWQGEGVAMRAIFSDTLSGNGVDPSAVTVTVRAPGGAVATPAPAVTRVSLGVYTFIVPALVAGKWEVEVACAAPDDARAVRSFVVVARAGQPQPPQPVPTGAVETVNGKPGPNPVLNAADVGAVAQVNGKGGQQVNLLSSDIPHGDATVEEALDALAGGVRTVNGEAPDEDGNVEIPTGPGGTVTAVNGKTPGEGGAVAITGADLPMGPRISGADTIAASVWFESADPLPQEFQAYPSTPGNLVNAREGLLAWLNKAKEAGIATVKWPSRWQWYFDGGDFIVPARLTVAGTYHPSGARPGSDFSAIPSSLIHSGQYRFRMQNGASVKGVCVVGKGLFEAGPLNSYLKGMRVAHAWQGAGISMGTSINGGLQDDGGGDACLEDFAVFGFDRCVDVLGASRCSIHNGLIEGNNGLNVVRNADYSRISHITTPVIIFNATPGANRYFIFTGIQDNGNGECRLTGVIQFGTGTSLSMASMEDGFWVGVDQVAGVPGANGKFQVDVINDTTLDLIGSEYDGTYTGGGRIVPALNWRIGTAYYNEGSDGIQYTSLVGNNYWIGYHVKDASATYVGCVSEGKAFSLKGHIGLWAEGYVKKTNIEWVGSAPLAFGRKMRVDGTGWITISGSEFPATTGISNVEINGGRHISIDGSNIGGTAEIADTFTGAFNLSGGRATDLRMLGSAAALRRVTQASGGTGSKAGIYEIKARQIDMLLRDTSNVVRRALRILPEGLELDGGVRILTGVGSPEGVVFAPLGTKYIQRNGKVATGIEWIKTTTAAQSTGWGFYGAITFPLPVLNAAVQAAVNYAQAGQNIIAAGELHPEAEFTRPQPSGSKAITRNEIGEWSEVDADTPRFFGDNQRLLIEPPETNENGDTRALGTPPPSWAYDWPEGLEAEWTEAEVDGVQGVVLTLTGTTTEAGQIIINGAGGTVATGATPAAPGETWIASAFMQVLPDADDPAVSELYFGIQPSRASGGAVAGINTPAWYDTRQDLAIRRSSAITWSDPETAACRWRFRTNTIPTDTGINWAIFIGWAAVAEQSAPAVLPVLPAPGTTGAAAHGGDALSIVAAGMGVDPDAGFSVLCVFTLYRASPAGVDQVLFRRGSATNCYMVYVEAGGLALKYRRVLGGTPETAVSLGNALVGVTTSFVFLADGAGNLSAAIAEPGKTLQMQAGTAVTGDATFYVGPNCHMEVGPVAVEEGVPL